MKIGDYVTTQAIASQSICRWVVLDNLTFSKNDCVDGGTIKYIAEKMVDAENAAFQLEKDGAVVLVVCGALESLCVGGVFVE